MSVPTKTVWRNRIVRVGEVSPGELVANPANWRLHPKNQEEALRGVLTSVGFVDPIIVQDGTGIVVDGHLRVAMALREDIEAIPVQYVDLNDDEVALVLATHDPIGEMAMRDRGKLNELTTTLATDNEDVTKLLERLSRETADSMEVIKGRSYMNGRKNAVIGVMVGVQAVQVIEQALAVTGLAHRGRALEMICREWLVSRGIEPVE